METGRDDFGNIDLLYVDFNSICRGRISKSKKMVSSNNDETHVKKNNNF